MVNAKEGSRIERLISGLERASGDPRDNETRAQLEQILSILPALDVSTARRIQSGPDSERLATLYRRYLREEEMLLAERFLESSPASDALRRGEGGLYGGASYARVRDLFERVDLEGCQEFVMVGSGPLPVTLLHVADATSIGRLIGLDVDEAALRISKELCQRLGGARIELQLCDGAEYDYGRAGAVYVANLVAPKAAVVARIAETARPGTQVVVREPVGAGILLADQGLETVDPGLKLLGWGPPRHRYFSRHAFLERRSRPTQR